MRRLCILLIPCVTLIACPAESSYVQHEKELVMAPELSCLEETLRPLAKKRRITIIREEIPLGIANRYIFDVGDAPSTFSVLVRPDGSAKFLSRVWAPKLKLKELREGERVLGLLESKLSGRCGIGDLETNATKSCFGVNCERL